jgi:hypothetical protein
MNWVTASPPVEFKRANKTDAGNGSKAICRVSNVLRSPSPDPRRSARIRAMKSEMKNTKAFLNGYTVVAIILITASSCQRGDHSTEVDKQKELERRVELLESRVELLLDRSQMEEAKQRAQQEGFDVHEIKPQQSR